MKKLYLFAILALVIAVMLSACAAPAAPAESGAMADEMVEEVTIKIITAQGPLADGLVALIPQFEDENPGIKVEVVPFPWTTFFEKVISLARSKSGEFDVIFADDPWMPNIVDGGLSVNLTEAYGATRDDDVPEISYDVFSWPPPYGPIPKDFQTGERPDLHALPIQGNVIMFYIRQGHPRRTRTGSARNLGRRSEDRRNGALPRLRSALLRLQCARGGGQRCAGLAVVIGRRHL